MITLGQPGGADGRKLPLHCMQMQGDMGGYRQAEGPQGGRKEDPRGPGGHPGPPELAALYETRQSRRDGKAEELRMSAHLPARGALNRAKPPQTVPPLVGPCAPHDSVHQGVDLHPGNV